MNSPQDGSSFEFVAEGAANVIFNICIETDDLKFGNGQHSLLRLRKATGSPYTVEEQFRLLSRLVYPLLSRTNLVRQDLVPLSNEMLREAQRALNAAERAGVRRPDRQGANIEASECHGLLLEDLRSVDDTFHTFEFKPKWLLQSPNAPSDATRCRTCALDAMRKSQASSAQAGQRFCPLGLASKSRASIDQLLQAKLHWPRVDKSKLDKTRRQLLRYLTNPENVLDTLLKLQAQHDPCGILSFSSADEISESFLVSMALRDCTLFVRTHASSEKIEAKLADLDIKPATPAKFEHWQKTERELVVGGWYSPDHPDKVCFLSARDRPTGDLVGS